MRGSAKPVDELCVLSLHPEPLPELVEGLSRGSEPCTLSLSKGSETLAFRQAQ